MQYWLMKSEPSEFSLDDLQRKGREPWDGVRNYQVRNWFRDQMRPQDLAFFYHSNCAVPGIVGVMEILTPAYPDPTAFEPDNPHYDPKSDPAQPRWYLVDVGYVAHFPRTVSLSELALLRRGNRLSVMPVAAAAWEFIMGLQAGPACPSTVLPSTPLRERTVVVP